MRYKIIALLLAVSLLGATHPVLLSSGTAFAQDTHAAELLRSIGAFDNIKHEIDLKSEITRAEFASVLLKLIRYESSVTDEAWRDTYFGDTEQETALRQEPDYGKYIFDDVKPDHWAYEHVTNVYNLGLMNGAAPHSFRPDTALTVAEAVKTLITMMGYDVKARIDGGYPLGYMAVARELRMFTGLALSSPNDTLSYAEFCELIYNCLDVEMLQMIRVSSTPEYNTVEGETFMTELLKLYRIRDVMTANDVTTFVGESSLKKGNVKIGDMVLGLSASQKEVSRMVGREVVAYYTQDEVTDLREIVYAHISEHDESILIQAEDIAGYENDVLEYEVNNRTKTVDINGLPFIYNGVALSSYPDSIFENIENGSVLISNNGQDDIAVIVWDYKALYVYGVDTVNERVISGYEDGVELNLNSVENTVAITDESGNAAEFTDITRGSVLNVAKNGSNMVIIICKRTETQVISEIDYTENQVITQSGAYKISSDFAAARNKKSFEPGSEVTIYFDSFNNVAWLDVKASEYVKAYLIKWDKSSSMSDDLVLKVYDLRGAAIKALGTLDKVYIEDETGTGDKYKGAAAIAKLKQGYIEYKADETGKVTHIYLPLAKKSNDMRTYAIVEGKALKSRYETNYNFNGRFMVNDNTLILNVPTEKDDESRYTMSNKGLFYKPIEYTVSAYASNPNAYFAEVVITNESSGGALSTDHVFIVANITTKLDKDGEKVKVVYGRGRDGEKTYAAKFDQQDAMGNACTKLDIAEDVTLVSESTKKVKYQINKGDIVLIRSRSSMIAEVEDVQLLYRDNAPELAGTPGSKGAMVGVTQKVFARNDSVDVVNDINKVYDAPTLVQSNANPFVYGTASTGVLFNTNGDRVLYGFVYDMSGDALKITTQDLSREQYRESGIPAVIEHDATGNYTGVYISEVQSMSSHTSRGKVIAVDYYKDRVETRAGTAKDIKTYKNVGAKCSRVITNTTTGIPSFMIIINDYRD